MNVTVGDLVAWCPPTPGGEVSVGLVVLAPVRFDSTGCGPEDHALVILDFDQLVGRPDQRIVPFEVIGPNEVGVTWRHVGRWLA